LPHGFKIRTGASQLRECAWPLRREIFSASPQNAERVHDRYKHERIFRHPRKRQSPASDGACGVGPAACGWISLWSSLPFSSSRLETLPFRHALSQFCQHGASNELNLNVITIST